MAASERERTILTSFNRNSIYAISLTQRSHPIILRPTPLQLNYYNSRTSFNVSNKQNAVVFVSSLLDKNAFKMKHASSVHIGRKMTSDDDNWKCSKDEWREKKSRLATIDFLCLGEQSVTGLLGIAEEHVRVLLEEDWVVDGRIADAEGPLHHHHLWQHCQSSYHIQNNV